MKITKEELQRLIQEEIKFEQTAHDILNLIESLEKAGCTEKQIRTVLLGDLGLLQEKLDIMATLNKIFSDEITAKIGDFGSFFNSSEALSSIKETVVRNLLAPIITKVFNLDSSSPIHKLLITFTSKLFASLSFEDYESLFTGESSRCKLLIDRSFDSAFFSLVKEIVEMMQKTLFPGTTPAVGFFAKYAGETAADSITKMIVGDKEHVGKIKASVTSTICDYVDKTSFTDLVKHATGKVINSKKATAENPLAPAAV